MLVHDGTQDYTQAVTVQTIGAWVSKLQSFRFAYDYVLRQDTHEQQQTILYLREAYPQVRHYREDTP